MLALALTSPQACAAVFILAREDEGNRRFMKEEMPKIICRILDYPVC